MVAVGVGFTVTAAEPVPTLLQPVASRMVLTVTVLEELGLISKLKVDKGILLITESFTPSVRVKFHGLEPLKFSLTLILSPSQMLPPPVIDAVGIFLMVTLKLSTTIAQPFAAAIVFFIK